MRSKNRLIHWLCLLFVLVLLMTAGAIANRMWNTSPGSMQGRETKAAAGDLESRMIAGSEAERGKIGQGEAEHVLEESSAAGNPIAEKDQQIRSEVNGTLPSAYDGRKEGRVPSIRNQGTLGTCWAFASLVALETRLLPDEAYEFSADHMSLNNGFCIPQEEGGEYTMSMAYLLSWRGPVTERMDPYGDGSSPDGLQAVKHVQEILLVPAKDFEKIKRAILQYGGVQSSLYTSMKNDADRSVYYNDEKAAYCYVGSNPPNHDSVIVGWDDDYPKENFHTEVNGDGAFICMNSWGGEFGEQGFFYVSYYDSNIGMSNIIYTAVEAPDHYTHIYQSDLRGWVGQLGYGTDTVWMSNIYTAAGSERLGAVGFYATGRYTSYEVYLVHHAGEEGAIDFESRVLAASGQLDYAGYYTIPLDLAEEEALNLDVKERYGVVVKITTPDAVHPAAIEYDAKDGRTTVDITDGEGYISADGYRWDRVESAQSCNLCLKAYTIDR